MTAILIYAFIAVAILTLTIILIRKGRLRTDLEVEGESAFHSRHMDWPSLEMVERIFDPGDYRWLRDELKFPHLARALARHRKEMAIHWLKSLRRSYNELIRSPEPVVATGNTDPDPPSWVMLFLTLRFHFLLGYALLMVRLFGPYHQLVPSFDWMRIFSSPERGEPYGSVGAKGA